MLTREQLLGFVTQYPGATNNDVAKRFAITPAVAATRTKQLFDGGYVTRKQVSKTATSSPIYGYFAHLAVTLDTPKKERIAQAKKQLAHALENDKTTVGATDLTSMIQGLSDAIAKQIAAQVVVSLQSSLPREMAGIVPDAPPVPKLTLNLAALPAPSPVIAAKPRIGIVGLLSQQEQVISSEFADVYDLRFWKDESTSALKAMGRSCELVLVTKWSNHSSTETLKSVGATWRFIDGGLSELKSALTAVYLEGV